MVVPVVHRSVGEMVLDRRVHIRVCRILIMHWDRFVEPPERVCCWRLQRVDKRSWIGGIVVLGGWEKVTRGSGVG